MSAYDVAVVGAGPAGCTAAHRLATAGLRVALLEKEQLPRYKTCGGGLVPRAVSLLPGDIAPVVERHCHRAEMHLVDAGLSFGAERPTFLIMMAMRDQLDARLADWQAPPPRYAQGVFAKYAALVSSASEGAVTSAPL